MEKDTSYSSQEKIHQDEVSIVNIYAPNTKTFSYVKETLLKVKLHIKSLTLIVGHFNTPLSLMDRSDRQKLNRYHDSNELNRNLQDISPKHTKIYFLLRT